MPPNNNPWPWRLLAAILILGAAGLHVAYFCHHCPLDLAPDEAHYWDWSRHLDWSYYSKGPLVAYLIRAGCLLGGDTMPAVRLPAVLCGGLLLVSMYVLTVQVFGREKWAAAMVALALTLPIFVGSASLMTIDAPYTCCWGWAVVLGHRAIFRRSWWSWPAAGLVVGLGILAKYTMVLWLPSVALFLLTARKWRRGKPTDCNPWASGSLWSGFWTAAGIAALCCIPILFWNANHGWVTLHHVGGQAGVEGRESFWTWNGPLHYLGSQFAVLLGFWFVVWLAAMVAHRPTVESDAGIRYLWWMSAPMFAVFLAFSIKNGGGQANWPITAYLSGLVLAVGWLGRKLASSLAWRWGLAITCGLGLAVSILMHHAECVYPLLVRVAGSPTRKQPLPLRRMDPTCRLRGWRTLAREVDRLRAELASKGTEPVLAGTGWTLPGELGFYCSGHPQVYSIGLALGDRRSQYDFWRPNPVWDAEAFLGRTFIVVGPVEAWLRFAFDELEPPVSITHYDGGQPVSSWPIQVCQGFRGFLPIADLLRFQRF